MKVEAVDATGCAMVTRLSVELVPNREISDDRSPKSTDTDDGSDSPDTYMVEQDNNDNHHKLRRVKSKILKLILEKRKGSDAVRSADLRLELLNTYMRGIAGNPEHSQSFLQDGMKTYQKERENALHDLLEWQVQVEKIEKEILALQKHKERLRKSVTKERAKVRHERAMRNEHIRKEQELRRPEQVYAVTISIDVEPTSDSDEELARGNAHADTCDLTLSYATSQAFWSPIYDMTLSTATGSGTLYFDSLLVNETSETWDDCSIVLSTWEPTFSSLDDTLSALKPWPVSLYPSQRSSADSNVPTPDDHGPFLKQTAEGFMFCHAPPPPSEIAIYEDEVESPKCNRHITPGPENMPPESDGGFSGRSSPSPTGNHGPIEQTSWDTQPASYHHEYDSTAYDTAAARPPLRTIRGHTPFFFDEDDESVDDSATVQAPLTTIRESKKPEAKETELMATYSLVERRSLSPSLTESRHRVARIPLSDANFSRIVVPKNTEAVFLNAQLRNSSNFSLPPGTVELTLDGRHVGKQDLPSWRPSGICTLALGIDPWIRVIYREPEVKHNKHLMISSDEQKSSVLFTRTIVLVNTRDEFEGRPVDVTVLDRVPVSSDRKLEVELVTPNCLEVDGPGVFAGEPGDGTSGRELWGKAEARLKPGGEVEWAVSINPRCAAKLRLAYLCTIYK